MNAGNRTQAIDLAVSDLDGGAFERTLRRRVAIRSESQNPDRRDDLRAYLREIDTSLNPLGFSGRIIDDAGSGLPFLIAARIEDPALPTVLSYGHGDVILGMDDAWNDGLSPWDLTERDGRWYGRGVADNKGQHSINIAALAAAITARGGRLGYNVKILIEVGEEIGSTGLNAFCLAHKDLLAADLFVASDGPRLAVEHPTLFLGVRGVINMRLSVSYREGGRHSGNHGGLIRNPGTEIANAIACIVDRQGVLQVDAWKPPGIPDAVRRVLDRIDLTEGQTGREVDASWGEPGLSPAARVFAWPTCEVLAFCCGDVANPVNAIPPSAWAEIQLRFVVGIDPAAIVPILRRHLDAHGFGHIDVSATREEFHAASQISPDHPWVGFLASSVARTTGRDPVIIPCSGGSLPNELFERDLNLPTVWIPHSWHGCSQHAPNENVPLGIVREGLAIMAGVFWDIGDADPRTLGAC